MPKADQLEALLRQDAKKILGCRTPDEVAKRLAQLRKQPHWRNVPEKVQVQLCNFLGCILEDLSVHVPQWKFNKMTFLRQCGVYDEKY